MIGFKDVVAQDVASTFLNDLEFADVHDVNGKPMRIMIDSIEQIEREKRMSHHIDGTYQNQFLFYVAAVDYGPLPGQGSYTRVDGARYRILDAVEEDGVYSLTVASMAPINNPSQIVPRPRGKLP